MTGPRISTARLRETEQNKQEWLRKRKERNSQLREQFGASFKGFDDVGDPITANNQQARSMRGPEFVRALERALSATGDPVFDDALRAVRAYGLDKGGHGKVSRQIWGDTENGALVQIRFFVERRGLSVPPAVEKVVAELGLHGSSFEAIVQELSKTFRIWKKAGYPAEEIAFEAGDLGYKVEIGGIEDDVFDALSRSLPTQSREQPSTLYWRRVFRDGSVTLRRLGEK
ncbi:hypothetical protein [Methylobacterium mesophilicum]